MARPKKNTVDYFPHDCHWSKEIEIFVNKYGNNGYAFYYRLLELIGLTPLYLYDCNELRDWQYLLAKTSVEEDMAVELIEFLVALSIIDKEMWDKKKIWVQSFVDSIADVYNTRTTELPTKEGFQLENTTTTGFPTRKLGFSAENGSYLARNSQTKGKETKLNKKILNKRTGFLAKCDKCDSYEYVESFDTYFVCRKNNDHGRMPVTTL
jgi:hypothetical protein